MSFPFISSFSLSSLSSSYIFPFSLVSSAIAPLLTWTWTQLFLATAGCGFSLLLVSFIRQEIRLRRRRHARIERQMKLHKSVETADFYMSSEDDDDEDDEDDEDENDDNNQHDSEQKDSGATLEEDTDGALETDDDGKETYDEFGNIIPSQARAGSEQDPVAAAAAEGRGADAHKLAKRAARKASFSSPKQRKEDKEKSRARGPDEDEISYRVRRIKMFRYVEENLARTFCQYFEPLNVKENQVLFKKGDPSPDLWIVMEGTVQIFLDENDPSTHLCDIQHGETVMSLISYIDVMADEEAMPCQVSARALCDTQLLRMSSQTFRTLANAAPQAVAQVAQMIMFRLQRVTFLTLYHYLGLTEELLIPTEDHIDYSKTAEASPAGNSLPPAAPADRKSWTQNAVELILARLGDIHADDVELLRSSIKRIELQPGQYLHEAPVLPPPDSKENSSADFASTFGQSKSGIQFLVKGSVTLLMSQRSGQIHPLYEVGVGGIVGHLSALTGDQSNVLAKANAPSQLVSIPHDVFSYIANRNPRVVLRISLSLVRRLSPFVRQFDFALDWKYRKAGKVLFEEGDPCNGLYIVLHGRLRSFHRRPSSNPLEENVNAVSWTIGNSGSGFLEEYARGDSMGEIDLLTESNHSSTVIAIRDTEVCQIPRSLFNMIVKRYPFVMAHFARAMYKRIGGSLKRLTTTVAPTIHDKLAFSALAPVSKTAASTAAHSQQHSASPAAPASAAGAAFAPSSVPSSAPPSSSPSTTTTSSSSSAAHGLATVAVIGASEGVPIHAFTVRLVACLSKLGQTLHLDNKMVVSHFATNSVTRLDKIRLTSWLGRLEEENDVVVYEAENSASSWTRRCIRQADLILIVANGRDGPKKGNIEQEIEEFLHHSNARKELVILLDEDEKESQQYMQNLRGGSSKDPADASYGLDTGKHMKYTTPNGTRFWAAARSWTNAHHHVRIHRHLPLDTEHFKSDFARLARRIRGQSIGLVLGGGGAKGLSHVGILKQLEEHEIPIDLVGGTSIGAFVGGLYAKYRDVAKVEEKTMQYCKMFGDRRRLLRDVTFPMTSFLSGERYNRILRTVFSDTQIEDFMLPFFCTTTNITTNSLNIHQEGRAWRFIRASMTLASFLPPICEGSNLLLDGGYCNNLPADVMQSLGANTIIAVHVGTEDDTNYFNYGDSLSGWWLLWKKLNPFAAPVHVPSMSDVSQRICYIRSDINLEMVKNLYCNLFLRPPVNHYPLLAFNKYSEISAVGYEFAKQRIAEWINSGQLDLLHVPCKESVQAAKESAEADKRNAMPFLRRNSSFVFL